MRKNTNFSFLVNNTFICLSFFLTVILFSCSKNNNTVAPKETLSEEQTTANNSAGATQISGIGYYATAGECDYESQGAVYAIRMTGDLEGCLYAFIDDVISCKAPVSVGTSHRY